MTLSELSQLFGDDSELYGAMGYIRTSERKSGLTRKSKTGENNDENKK